MNPELFRGPCDCTSDRAQLTVFDGPDNLAWRLISFILRECQWAAKQAGEDVSVKEHMHRLMSEIGPLLELGAVIESDDGDGWILAIDEDDGVLVELDEAEGRILLSAEAGLPDDEARAQLCETLLVYNAQWSASGGVRMALDEPGGGVVQMLELSAAELDAARLSQVFVAFLETLSGWRTVVAEGPGGGDGLDASAADSGIRV